MIDDVNSANNNRSDEEIRKLSKAIVENTKIAKETRSKRYTSMVGGEVNKSLSDLDKMIAKKLKMVEKTLGAEVARAATINRRGGSLGGTGLDARLNKLVKAIENSNKTKNSTTSKMFSGNNSNANFNNLKFKPTNQRASANTNRTILQQQSFKNKQEKHEADLFAKSLNNTHKQETHEQKLHNSNKAYQAYMFGKGQTYKNKQETHDTNMFAKMQGLQSKKEAHDTNMFAKAQTLTNKQETHEQNKKIKEQKQVAFIFGKSQSFQQKNESHNASMLNKTQTLANKQETHGTNMFGRKQVFSNRQEMHQVNLNAKQQALILKKQSAIQNLINKQQLHNIKKQGMFQSNINKQEMANVKLQQTNILFEKKLQKMRKEEFSRFMKGLTGSFKGLSIVGMGTAGLGLLGGGLGGLLGGIPSLALDAVGGLVGGVGSALGGVGTAIGAGLGLKGIFGGNKRLQTVPTRRQSRIGSVLGGVGGLFGGIGKGTSKVGKFMRPLAKVGAIGGAGLSKLGGKGIMGFAGKLGRGFGKVPGLGMITKFIPGLNTAIALGSVGYGVYDAWNNTDNTKDFLKEASWNTGSNLLSAATLGMIEPDKIKEVGKSIAGKIENSDIYKNTTKRINDNIKDSRPYKSVKSGIDGVNSTYNDYFGNSDNKKTYDETIKNYEKGTNGKYNLNAKVPKWMGDSRGQLTNGIKPVVREGDLFNMGSTRTESNNTNVNNNNSVVNFYNEPAQNKMTPVMAFGGSFRDTGGF